MGHRPFPRAPVKARDTPTGKGDDRQHVPVTLDLNGKVLVPSRDPPQPRAIEFELTSSRLDGDPVVFCSDRPYVGQTMRPGFREAFFFSLTSPVLCRDERRQFLWAVLEQLQKVGG